MSKFGWSLPPGCSKLPYDDDYPCEVCGKFVEDCICPECPVCNTVGDENCYKEHGLELTWDQKIAKQEWEVEQSKLRWQEDMQLLDYYKCMKLFEEE